MKDCQEIINHGKFTEPNCQCITKTHHLNVAIESVCNFLCDLALQRKKISRKKGQRFRDALIRALIKDKISFYPKNHDFTCRLIFDRINIPNFLQLCAEQNDIKPIIINKAYRKFEMIITLKPNLVLLNKNGREIILYDNVQSNLATNPIYDEKPYTTKLLQRKYEI